MSCKAYPIDMSDEEWAFVVPHSTLIREDAGQRLHALVANRQLTDEDDASHRDRSTPSHFARGGFFWLGI